MCKTTRRFLVWLAVLANALLIAPDAHAKIATLVFADFYQPNGTIDIQLHALNHFMPMARMVSDEIAVFEVDSWHALQEKGKLNRYDVIVIWEFPRTIQRMTGQGQLGARTALDDDLIGEIVAFVRKGGGLILAGGAARVFCKNGYDPRSNQDDRFYGSWGYSGYFGSPVEALLPAKITTDEKGQSRIEWAESLPETAAIQAVAKEADEKMAPLVVGARVGNGRVLAVIERRDQVQRNLNLRTRQPTFWTKEGVLFDRAIRWAAGKEMAGEATEKDLIARYEEAISPPKEKPPLEWVADEYPFVIWSMTGHANFYNSRLTTKFFADLGFNRISHWGGWEPGAGAQAVADANDFNLWTYPNISNMEPTAHRLKKEGVAPAEWATVDQRGNPVMQHPVINVYGMSSYAPKSLEAGRAEAIKVAQAYKEHANLPNLKGFFLDDEQSYMMPADTGKGLVADYSPYANAYYKSKTGRNAPKPVYRKAGYVAPAGDPWIKWVELMRLGGHKPYCLAVRDGIRQVFPDAITGYFMGGFLGEADIIIDEFYLNMWKEDPTQATMRTDLGHARLDDLAGERTPYWSEIFLTKGGGCGGGGVGTAIDPVDLRLIAGLALGRGLRGLVLWEPFYVYEYQNPGEPPLDHEIKKIGAYLETYGPMLLKLRREPMPVWYLAGWLRPNSFDEYYVLTPDPDKPSPHPEWPWYNSHCDNLAWPAMARAQVPVEAVTERQLMSRQLFDKKAVVMGSLQFCREEVVDNLRAFLKQGGKVYLTECAAVKIPGATILPARVDQWYHATIRGERLQGNDRATDALSRVRRETYVRDIIPAMEQIVKDVDSEVRLTESGLRYGVYSLMRNGDARYLFVSNLDRLDSRRFDVHLKHPPAVVYDLHAVVKAVPLQDPQKTTYYQTRVEPGAWNILVLADKELAGLDIPQCKVEGKTLRLKVALQAGDGPFRAAVPLAITIRAENRQTTLYRSTDQGMADLTIPLGDYLRNVKEVAVKELLTGKEKTAQCL